MERRPDTEVEGISPEALVRYEQHVQNAIRSGIHALNWKPVDDIKYGRFLDAEGDEPQITNDEELQEYMDDPFQYEDRLEIMGYDGNTRPFDEHKEWLKANYGDPAVHSGVQPRFYLEYSTQIQPHTIREYENAKTLLHEKYNGAAGGNWEKIWDLQNRGHMLFHIREMEGRMMQMNEGEQEGNAEREAQLQTVQKLQGLMKDIKSKELELLAKKQQAMRTVDVKNRDLNEYHAKQNAARHTPSQYMAGYFGDQRDKNAEREGYVAQKEKAERELKNIEETLEKIAVEKGELETALSVLQNPGHVGGQTVDLQVGQGYVLPGLQFQSFNTDAALDVVYEKKREAYKKARMRLDAILSPAYLAVLNKLIAGAQEVELANGAEAQCPGMSSCFGKLGCDLGSCSYKEGPLALLKPILCCGGNVDWKLFAKQEGIDAHNEKQMLEQIYRKIYFGGAEKALKVLDTATEDLNKYEFAHGLSGKDSAFVDMLNASQELSEARAKLAHMKADLNFFDSLRWSSYNKFGCGLRSTHHLAAHANLKSKEEQFQEARTTVAEIEQAKREWKRNAAAAQMQMGGGHGAAAAPVQAVPAQAVMGAPSAPNSAGSADIIGAIQRFVGVSRRPDIAHSEIFELIQSEQFSHGLANVVLGDIARCATSEQSLEKYAEQLVIAQKEHGLQAFQMAPAMVETKLPGMLGSASLGPLQGKVGARTSLKFAAGEKKQRQKDLEAKISRVEQFLTGLEPAADGAVGQQGAVVPQEGAAPSTATPAQQQAATPSAPPAETMMHQTKKYLPKIKSFESMHDTQKVGLMKAVSQFLDLLAQPLSRDGMGLVAKKNELLTFIQNQGNYEEKQAALLRERLFGQEEYIVYHLVFDYLLQNNTDFINGFHQRTGIEPKAVWFQVCEQLVPEAPDLLGGEGMTHLDTTASF